METVEYALCVPLKCLGQGQWSHGNDGSGNKDDMAGRRAV